MTLRASKIELMASAAAWAVLGTLLIVGALAVLSGCASPVTSEATVSTQTLVGNVIEDAKRADSKLAEAQPLLPADSKPAVLVGGARADLAEAVKDGATAQKQAANDQKANAKLQADLQAAQEADPVRQWMRLIALCLLIGAPVVVLGRIALGVWLPTVAEFVPWRLVLPLAALAAALGTYLNWWVRNQRTLELIFGWGITGLLLAVFVAGVLVVLHRMRSHNETIGKAVLGAINELKAATVAPTPTIGAS